MADRLVAINTAAEPGEQLPPDVRSELIEVTGNLTAAVTTAIEENVGDAVEAAVTADIEGRDMLEGSDPRVPVILDTEDDWTAAGIGPAGEFWWGVRPDGTVEFGSTSVGGGVVTQSLDAEDLHWVAAVFPGDKYSEIHIDKNGRVQQWALDAWAERMNVSGAGTVHVLIIIGQSNASGRGLPISAEIDPPHPRIFQFGANSAVISEATVPLDMVDSAYGISPLTLIAREYMQRLPDEDVLLLVPAARGGTPLGAADDEHANGVWNAAYEGESVDLYGLAKAQIDGALAAAVERWPKASRRIMGVFWNQGEGNPGTDEATYASRFDAIVADLRSHLSDPDMPVVVGGMVPEWVTAESPDLDAVLAAHIDTPNRLVRAGYAIPPANSGGNANLDPEDRVHFHRAGLEELARRMLAAWDRALRNTETSIPHPPAVVSATVNNTLLTVEWSQPMCRYESFTPEFSDDDGDTWDEITHTSVDTTATATVSSAPILVRVATTNAAGTSPPSTPVYATVIKEPTS